MTYPIYQVNAFADKLFTGNPAAVCPLPSWLPDDVMQNIAKDLNLSETVFFVKNDDGYDIRWFTPTVEVDLCGHATLAAAYVLYNHLNYEADVILFNSKSGKLLVTKSSNWINLDFPMDEYVKVAVPEIVETALPNVNIVDFCKGKHDYMVVIDSEKDLRSLKPNFELLAKLDSRGTIVTAKGKEVDFVSRCFFPQSGVNEDPVTGSAHTTMTPYWSEKLGSSILSAQQVSERGGVLRCEILENNRVELSGKATLQLEGEININEAQFSISTANRRSDNN